MLQLVYYSDVCSIDTSKAERAGRMATYNRQKVGLFVGWLVVYVDI